jgi:hypothetical protein
LPETGAATATDGQMSAGCPEGSDAMEAAGQMSAGPDGALSGRGAELRAALFRPLVGRGAASCPRGAGRVTLRFRVGAETHQLYRRMERAFRRHGPGGVPFLRFLCLSFVEAWEHALPSTVAYGHIYERDRFQCQSPVCSRHDVTPHHLRYRAQGGDDSDENVISLCVWCHLEGIHGGRLRAAPPASAVNWQIGREPHLVVTGRVASEAPSP